MFLLLNLFFSLNLAQGLPSPPTLIGEDYNAQMAFLNSDGSVTLVEPYFWYQGEKLPYLSSTTQAPCRPYAGELHGLTKGICRNANESFTQALFYQERPLHPDDPQRKGRSIGVDVNEEGFLRGVCTALRMINTVTCY